MRKYTRQLQTFLFATMLYAVAVTAMLLMIAFYQEAKAEGSTPNQVGWWYNLYTSDSRTAHNDSIMMVTNASEAYSYGRGVDFGSNEFDIELIEARNQHTLGCFGELTRKEIAKAFFGWTLSEDIDPELSLAFSVALFTEVVCIVADGETKEGA